MSRLERLTERARERCAEARARRAEDAGRAPSVGDVLRLDETADLAVLWALAAYDEERRQFVAVAADLNPLLASSDVAVPRESPCGELSLRCAVEVRLARQDVERARRLGTLDGSVVAQMRRRRAEILSGSVAGGLFAQETDVDPEYRDWLEEGPEQAKARLLRQARVLEFHRPRRERFLGIPATVAASVLLAVSLGLLAALAWQSGKPRTDTGEVVHLPFAVLATGKVRHEAEVLEVPAAVASVLLLVETSTTYPRYRLELREKDGDGLLWASDGLEPTKERRGRFEPVLLPVVLPRRLLGDGEYRVLLFGLRDGRTEALEEHLLLVRAR